jgi:hypothetical protein
MITKISRCFACGAMFKGEGELCPHDQKLLEEDLNTPSPKKRIEELFPEEPPEIPE